METYHDSSEIFLQHFFKVPFDFPYIFYWTLWLLISVTVTFILAIFYKKIRRIFPVKVNCWFCNNYTSVPYEFVNSWDCPQCKQYNGFNEDGSYNKVIEEQYNAKLNEDIFNSLKPSYNNQSGFQSNRFCKLCNINQQLKIQQLALFTPLDENNYYEEVEKYREKLEKAYCLCSKCEKVLKETLEKQDYNLLRNRLNDHKHFTSSQKIKNFKEINKKKLVQSIQKNGVISLSWICLIIGFSQFLALIVKFGTEHQILNQLVRELEISNFMLENLKHYMSEVYKFNKEVSFAGLISSLFIYILRPAKKNQNTLLVWGLLHISFWSTLFGVQIVLSGVCVYINAKSAQKQFSYINKNSLQKKSGFRPLKKVFPEVYNTANLETELNDQSSPSLKNESFGLSNKKSDLKNNRMWQNENIRTTKKSELESSVRKAEKEDTEEELPMNKEKIDHIAEATNEASAPLSSSLFSKSFLSSLEPEKNEAQLSESFNEVYNGLNGLHLGGKQKKSKKSSNFLLSSPGISPAKTSSVIKPAKLIKNLNSTLWSESNEYNSRSSTPSSQKTEKVEPNRFDFFKTMTPISVSPFSRHSSVNCWDYDGSNGFYNNFNYNPPGFLHFQQFPAPMGHTTIYTSSRPTNFPFPLSPWQGFANPKFYPTSHFPDFSDCDNLFQDTSRNFEKHKKWFKLKLFLYNFSFFMNIVIFSGLFYFVSTGIILVDWNLPTLNFFQ